MKFSIASWRGDRKIIFILLMNLHLYIAILYLYITRFFKHKRIINLLIDDGDLPTQKLTWN